MNEPRFSRRLFLLTASTAVLAAQVARAEAFRELTWEELIPPGIAYPEIVGEGEYDEAADTWKPVFDENAKRLNPSLEGAQIKLPGYIIPMDQDANGVTSFILVPYVGACIHVPPPPPNQLVLVTTQTPWPSDKLWDAVWVYGRMSTGMQSTEIAEIGYQISAERIEIYEW